MDHGQALLGIAEPCQQLPDRSEPEPFVAKIRPLLESVPVNIAVSLHATTDDVRDRLVPLNRRFPLNELLATLRGLDCITPRRPVFFEYTLIDGVNDGPEDAIRLAQVARSLPSKVNLIPMNSHPDSTLRPPPEETVDRFLRELASRGTTVTLRRSRGSDIQAACGQLALREARQEPVIGAGAPA